MSDLPHSWAEYARVQEELAESSHVNGRSWGLEAALNRLLTQPQKLLTSEDTDRAVRSESRKERYRATLRRIWLVPEIMIGGPGAALDARRRLHVVKTHVTAENWALLRAVGEGYDYGEIAAEEKVTAGAVRARVFRLRRVVSRRLG